METQLGDAFEVIAPVMPNKYNCKYAEWKIWLEKVLPLLNPEIILIGHSMGGIFVAKYLAENYISKKVLGTFLVAAPYDTEGVDYELCDFGLTEPLSQLEEQGGKIVIYQSKDDHVVPFKNAEKYKKELPSAELKMMEDRGHFNQPQFPELVADIKSLIN